MIVTVSVSKLDYKDIHRSRNQYKLHMLLWRIFDVTIRAKFAFHQDSSPTYRTLDFSDINFLQVIVATCLRYDAIFNDCFSASFMQSVLVKNF